LIKRCLCDANSVSDIVRGIVCIAQRHSSFVFSVLSACPLQFVCLPATRGRNYQEEAINPEYGP
jgi:hypothetical protein